MTHDVSQDVPCGDQGGCCDPQNSKQEAGRPDHAEAMHRSQKPQPACEDKSPLQCPVLDLHCMQVDSCRECNDLLRWGICCLCLLATGLQQDPLVVPCSALALHAGRFLQGMQ